jgi:DNA-directed RNA polymerase sigma subunit (sigma70/sigma32)
MKRSGCNGAFFNLFYCIELKNVLTLSLSGTAIACNLPEGTMSDTVATLAKSASKSNAEDVLQAYFAQIKDNPLLEFEEELELSRRIMGGDPQARQKLVESNSGWW